MDLHSQDMVVIGFDPSYHHILPSIHHEFIKPHVLGMQTEQRCPLQLRAANFRNQKLYSIIYNQHYTNYVYIYNVYIYIYTAYVHTRVFPVYTVDVWYL